LRGCRSCHIVAHSLLRGDALTISQNIAFAKTCFRIASYCRLVKCAKESAGKRYGTGGTKIGNAYLKWAFSEAAVLFLRDNPSGQKYLTRLEKKHGKGKALTILAHHLARAVYFMFKRHPAFAMNTFLNGEGRGAGEPDG
jgi:transposase